MSLPFTPAQFLDNFAAYNLALWPALVLLWLATLVLTARFVGSRRGSESLGVLLAIQWFWVGGAYFAVFFARVNPVAWLFAALFTVQALAILWHAVTGGGLQFVWRWSIRHVAAAVLIAYALVYPGLVLLSGHAWPRAPLVGVPCQVTLFTAGLLLAAVPPVPRSLLVIPVLWSVVGARAAISFDVTPDWMLVVAAVALIGDALFAPGRPHRLRASLAERARPRVVDRFVRDPNYRQVLAIDIDAPPSDVWPWLVQMGYQRGGLYSFDWLDRLFGYLDRPSADVILPAYQDLRPGDLIPIGRGGGFPVASVEVNRSLVMAGTEEDFAWGWELALEGIGDRRTRLVSRNLARAPQTWKSRAFLAVLRPAAFIMTHRMLGGIKRRAEARVAVTPAPLGRAA